MSCLSSSRVFAKNFRTDAVGKPCEIPSGAGEARDEPVLNGIVKTYSDDGDRLGGILGCQRRSCRRHCHDVHLEPDQRVCEGGKPIVLALRKPIIDSDVLALHPSELAQSLPERL